VDVIGFPQLSNFLSPPAELGVYPKEINCFNLEDKPVRRRVRFRPAEVGLPKGTLQVEGAPLTVGGDEISLDIAIPAKRHELVKVGLKSER